MKDRWLSLCTYDHYKNGLGTVITKPIICMYPNYYLYEIQK